MADHAAPTADQGSMASTSNEHNQTLEARMAELERHLSTMRAHSQVQAPSSYPDTAPPPYDSITTAFTSHTPIFTQDIAPAVIGYLGAFNDFMTKLKRIGETGQKVLETSAEYREKKEQFQEAKVQLDAIPGSSEAVAITMIGTQLLNGSAATHGIDEAATIAQRKLYALKDVGKRLQQVHAQNQQQKKELRDAIDLFKAKDARLSAVSAEVKEVIIDAETKLQPVLHD